MLFNSRNWFEFAPLTFKSVYNII